MLTRVQQEMVQIGMSELYLAFNHKLTNVSPAIRTLQVRLFLQTSVLTTAVALRLCYGEVQLHQAEVPQNPRGNVFRVFTSDIV